tara:strand:- start:290 stop:511 length:222 start_codon:yes stop_codon:yes gene_type:complete
MSLPSQVQGQLEDMYDEAVSTIYDYVDNNIEEFIEQAIAHALYQNRAEEWLREDELEIDVHCAISDYLKKRRN